MHWVYLSPHFDDVVFSCGGLIWQQTHKGDRVEIWTLCAGEIPRQPLTQFALSLHERWQTGRDAVKERRDEDAAACTLLGAAPVYFNLPDCIYRVLPDGEAVIQREEDLFQPLRAGEMGLVDQVAVEISARLPQSAQLVSPLSVGGHMDHRLVRVAAEKIRPALWYYADYPYSHDPQAEVEKLVPGHYESVCLEKNPLALAAWQKAAACYGSQISTFWDGLGGLERAIKDYSLSAICRSLWKPPAS